jgi:hypothetical protein
MDVDENDILFTNQFINEPFQGTVDARLNDEFRSFYKTQQEKNQVNRTLEVINKLESQVLDEDLDDGLPMNTQRFSANVESSEQSPAQRKKRDKITFLSIDSRDRNKISYPKPSHFKVYLGRTFYNVKSVRLSSLEFPNTNAVINSNNNKIYWRNLEDITNDTINPKTNTYPVYDVTIRTGSYTLTTLQKEINTKLSSVRKTALGVTRFHFADTNLDYDTDTVSVTFLDLTLLDSNSLITIQDSNTITVQFPRHPFKNGDTVFFREVSSVGGITASTLNSSFTVINATTDTFQFDVNTRASASTSGGGTKIRCGKSAPFQLLFGDYPNTIAGNLGYPLRNSADRIDESITHVGVVNLIEVQTLSPHTLTNTYDNIGKLVPFVNVPGITGSRQLVRVTSPTTLLLRETTPLVNNIVYTPGSGGSVPSIRLPVTNDIITISTVRNFTAQSLLIVKTLNNHGYDLSNIGNNVNFFNTDSVPPIDGENTIFAVPDRKTLYIVGRLEVGGQSGQENGSTIHGNFPFNNPLTTVAFDVVNAQILGGVLLELQCNPVDIEQGDLVKNSYQVQDLLKAGDRIKLINVQTLPRQLSDVAIASVVGNSIFIEVSPETVSTIEITPSAERVSAVGTDVMVLTLHKHGFNQVSGFRSKNEQVSLTVTQAEPVTNFPNLTRLVYSPARLLKVGETVDISNSTILNGNAPFDALTGVFTINRVISPTSIEINTGESTNFTLVFPSTGANLATLSYVDRFIEVETVLPHGLLTGNSIRIMETNTGNEVLDTFHRFIRKIDDDTFAVPYSRIEDIESNAIQGILGMSNEFILYNASAVGGIEPEQINGQRVVPFTMTESTLLFNLPTGLSTATERGGGRNIHINSLRHGFRGTQTNLENDVIYRSISLEGEQYAFLQCPTLGTLISTGLTKDVFARISLSESPGAVIFNSFLSSPKVFEDGSLPTLTDLEFSVTLYDGQYYDFNDLDFSFTLEITEDVDYLENTNLSSRRGVTEHG